MYIWFQLREGHVTPNHNPCVVKYKTKTCWRMNRKLKILGHLFSGDQTNPHHALQRHKPKFWHRVNSYTIAWLKDLSLVMHFGGNKKGKKKTTCKWAVSLASYTSYSAAAGGLVRLNLWWLLRNPCDGVTGVGVQINKTKKKNILLMKRQYKKITFYQMPDYWFLPFHYTQSSHIRCKQYFLCNFYAE